MVAEGLFLALNYKKKCLQKLLKYTPWNQVGGVMWSNFNFHVPTLLSYGPPLPCIVSFNFSRPWKQWCP